MHSSHSSYSLPVHFSQGSCHSVSWGGHHLRGKFRKIDMFSTFLKNLKMIMENHEICLIYRGNPWLWYGENIFDFYQFYLANNIKYWVSQKKLSHESEEKMRKKMKMTLYRAKNLVHAQQHYGVSFYKKIFFIFWSI